MNTLERRIQLALRNLREKLAREQAVEPYKIFHNETIDLIALSKPITNLDLLAIKGIGPAKAKQFGKAILALVAGALEGDKEEEEIGESKIYSVGEFLDHFNDSFARKPLAIRGEVVDVKRPRPGLVYFSLKDENEEALLTCFMRSGVEDRGGVALEDGAKVVASGYFGVYKPSGRFSLQVTEFLLEGEGALKIAFEELKRRLESEGIFRVERKRTLPSYIKTIGLVTAAGSDAERDFLTHIGDYGYKVFRYDARVEGLRAVEQITRAIEFFNTRAEEIDVIVVTRGGGSMESLQAFNSEHVARVIFSSRVPVISAVGHEKDVSIADLVSDVRASTPTDAGKIISEDWRRVDQKTTDYFENFQGTIKNLFATTQKDSEVLLSEISRNLSTTFHRTQARLEHTDTLLTLSAKRIFEYFSFLEQGFSRASLVIESKIRRYYREIITTKESWVQIPDDVFKLIHTHISSETHKLELASPHNRLKQGYSLALAKGKIVSSVSDIAKGDKIELTFYNGSALTRVEDITKDK